MKKIIILIVLLLSAAGFTQTPNWTSVKETNINVSNALYFGGVDIFTNRDGNHIIVQENNNLKYYKMNLNGVAGSPITIEYSAVFSPSISGDANNIYIVYGIGSQVRVKRSINGGNSWNLWTYFNLSTSASYMESVFSNENLHVTYLESGIVKYSYRNKAGGSWNGPHTVSTGETGTYPKITARYTGVNEDYVYFMWQKSGTNTNNWRKYRVTQNDWTSVLSGYTVSEPNLVSSNLAGIRVTSTTLVIYYSFYENGTYSHRLGWAWKRLSDNAFLGYLPNPYSNFNQLVYSTTTFDNNSHSAFYYKQIAGGEGGGQIEDFAIWRSKSISGYPDDIIYNYGLNPPSVDPMHVNVSSAGNEVHVIWKDSLGSNNGNNLRYRWENLNPIAPQNLTMSSHNNHPKLVWQKNPEQDIDYYRIYRRIGSLPFTLHTTVSASLPTEYIDNEETVCNPPPGAQCQSGTVAKYYITAVDLTAKVSPASNEVEAIVQGEDPYKISVNNPTEVVDNYELSQNYPNPFNPTTTISYSIKTSGEVSLKVYDMLGTEVASLVNENQEAGNYSVTFNASNLPSGIYVYALTSGNFVDTKKLILLK